MCVCVCVVQVYSHKDLHLHVSLVVLFGSEEFVERIDSSSVGLPQRHGRLLRLEIVSCQRKTERGGGR